jgi:MYXO-CTERM domain-containing protein
MKRILLGLVISLGLAPAAVAKGPHAIIDSSPEGLDPGEPWVTTLTLEELAPKQRLKAKPRMVLRSGARRFSVWPRRTVPGAYAVRVVFPSAGRWRYTVVDGQLRFRFPAVMIGGKGGRDTLGYVAFPAGSEAAAQGAGGPYEAPPEPEPGGALPPEVVLPEEEDSDGVPLWIPAAGLTLVGAGGVAVARRRRH